MYTTNKIFTPFVEKSQETIIEIINNSNADSNNVDQISTPDLDPDSDPNFKLSLEKL